MVGETIYYTGSGRRLAAVDANIASPPSAVQPGEVAVTIRQDWGPAHIYDVRDHAGPLNRTQAIARYPWMAEVAGSDVWGEEPKEAI